MKANILLEKENNPLQQTSSQMEIKCCVMTFKVQCILPRNCKPTMRRTNPMPCVYNSWFPKALKGFGSQWEENMQNWRAHVPLRILLKVWYIVYVLSSIAYLLQMPASCLENFLKSHVLKISWPIKQHKWMKPLLSHLRIGLPIFNWLRRSLQ